MYVTFSAAFNPSIVPKINTDAKIVIAITKTVQTELSKPTARPLKIVVAEPVSVDFLIS